MKASEIIKNRKKKQNKIPSLSAISRDTWPEAKMNGLGRSDLKQWYLETYETRRSALLTLAKKVNGNHKATPDMWVDDTYFCLTDSDIPEASKEALLDWVSDLYATCSKLLNSKFQKV